MTSADHHHFDDQHGEAAKSPAPADRPAFERHYRVGELAEVWNLGRERGEPSTR